MNFNWKDFLIFKLVNVLFLDTTHLNNTDTAPFLKGCSILAIWTWSSLSCEIIVTSIWLEYARDRVPDPFCQRLYSNGVYCLSGLGLLFCRVIPPCICPGRQMRLFTIISCHATYAFYLKSLFGDTILMEILTLAKTSNFTFTFSFISYLTKAGSVIHTASVIGSWNHLQFRSSLLINGHTPLSLSRVILCCAEKKMMGWWYVLDDHDTRHYFYMRWSHYQSQYFICVTIIILNIVIIRVSTFYCTIWSCQ